MTDTIATLRRQLQPEDQLLLDQLATARTQLASVVLDGPRVRGGHAYQQQLVRLTKRVQELEADVSARSAAFRAQAQTVTLEQVQRAIPQDSVLIEFVSYQPFVPQQEQGKKPWQVPRYLAYLLPHQGAPTWIDLGETAAIDREVAKLRHALSARSHTTYKMLARALDEKLMRPIRQRLGEKRRVFLSPDGALHVLPFGALVDQGARLFWGQPINTETKTCLAAEIRCCARD